MLKHWFSKQYVPEKRKPTEYLSDMKTFMKKVMMEIKIKVMRVYQIVDSLNVEMESSGKVERAVTMEIRIQVMGAINVRWNQDLTVKEALLNAKLCVEMVSLSKASKSVMMEIL